MKIISSTLGPTIGSAATGREIRDFLPSELFTVPSPLPSRVVIVGSPPVTGTFTPLGAQSATVASGGGGSGYAQGDVLTIVGGTPTGGTFGAVAQFTVTGVTAGAVTGVALYTGGYGSYGAAPTNPVDTTTSGAGVGCKLTAAWESLDAVVSVMATANTFSTTDVPAMVPLFGYATGPATYTSSDTLVATIDPATGVVTPVAQGDCAITIAVPGLDGIRRVVPISVVYTPMTTAYTLSNFAAGSLGAHLAGQISPLITGSPPALSSPPISGTIINILTGAARNPTVYTGTVDLTAIPIGPVYGRQGVLVTPRDLICALHFWGVPGNALGIQVQLLDNAHNRFSTGVAAASVLSSPVGDSDIMVMTLAEDVPSGITPVAVLPSNFRSYLPQPQYGYPCIFTNQDYALPLGDLTATWPLDLTIGKPLDAARAYWWYAVRPNDSGSGAFMLIHGALVMVTDWHYLAGQGPLIADNLLQIQAAINANWAAAGFPGTAHMLTQVDLSGFTSY